MIPPAEHPSSPFLRRHSIFIKICLAFWLATALIILAQIGIDQLTGPGRQCVPMRRDLDFAIHFFARQAGFHYLKGDMDTLRRLRDDLQTAAGMDAYLLDETGRSVDGRVPPFTLHDQLRRAHRSGKVEPALYHDRVVLVLSPVRVHAGNTPGGPGPSTLSSTAQSGGRWFSAVMIVSRPEFAPFHEHPFFMTTRLFIVLLLSGVVCLALARYLTTPIIQLSTAARRVAAGDLSVRTWPLMGRRRDELSRLAFDFDHMAGRIEKLMLMHKQLFFDISHELRSPLARLQVALELARRQPPETAAKAFERIEREAALMENMIDQLLMLARMETANLDGEFEEMDLTRMVEGITADADYEAQDHRRGVVLAEAYPVKVWANPELLRQALENVVRNAINYTHENTAVEIRLIRCMQGGKPHACFSVRDHGSGIPENLLPNLFRPFFRVSKARERQTGGAGLGLTITEYTVRLHHGSVRARNAEGGGLLVEIFLPLSPASAEKAAPADNPAQNSA